ncbi:hypothetical protein [Streptomyces rubradiris]|uniref:Deacetylase sirtuin-type domain-containing protein n=1 Tax=Streptomyces rubradiris TaxID=285531 RepID=A0ABQ3RDH9_STRRR|nr:hypothetical protein [Streptomyces rubradiris]GHG95421.1 hypothetical protein GCM10018792_06200 [Streptomyces rubradiris]GHI53883.1 hypothetical protein Srubr_37290 [Streptomyces rubradiris]
MFLPHPVCDSLTPEQVRMWDAHFSPEAGGQRRPAIEEGIWRRTQEPGNRELSGWTEEESGRRRVVHYRLHYGLDRTQPMERLVLEDLYLFVSWLAPAAEIEAHRRDLDKWLADGRWKPAGEDGSWRRGDLRVTINEYAVHPQDERADRDTPEGFASVDVTIHSEDYTLTRAARNLPWDVLAGGMRVKEQRGNPTYADDLSGLLDHLPFVVEAGCGTSIEAGIPPLHWLHEVYRVTARTGNDLTQGYAFTLAPADDILVKEVLTDTARKVDDMVSMFRTVVLAEPTSAHRVLKALHDAGHMVGPVATHNFDRLFAKAGLPEAFMRRYDQRTPHMPFPDEAKALLVIGLHADRRAVQARARERGLPIFYLDTEGVTENGVHKPYLIEGAREGDIVVRSEATPALLHLAELLNVHI